MGKIDLVIYPRMIANYRNYPDTKEAVRGIVVIRVLGGYANVEPMVTDVRHYMDKEERQHWMARLSYIHKVDNIRVLLSVIPDAK